MFNLLIVANLLMLPVLPAGLATVTLLACGVAAMACPVADLIEAVIS